MYRGRGVLAHPVGYCLSAVFLARERQRSSRISLVISVIECVDRSPIASQQGLASAVEVNHRRSHGVSLLCAVRDRFTHEFVGKWRRQLLQGDQPLGLNSWRNRGDDAKPNCPS